MTVLMQDTRTSVLLELVNFFVQCIFLETENYIDHGKIMVYLLINKKTTKTTTTTTKAAFCLSKTIN